MDILHLHYFLEVARQKSFTRASQTLRVSQPSISKVVKTLENELNATLFERSSREVELTDAGKIVFARASQVVDEFHSLTVELGDVFQVRKGEITIGLPPMVGARFFPGVIGRFRQIYPQVQVKLIEVGSNQVEIGVDEGSLDLGVVALPVGKDNYETFPFVSERLQVVVPAGHRLAGETELTLEQLRDEEFVLYKDDFSLYDHILKECRQKGFFPRLACQSSQWDFIVEMVGAGLGIALLPETICREMDKRRFCSIPLTEPVIPWNLAVIWKRGKYLSFAARAWLKMVREYF